MKPLHVLIFFRGFAPPEYKSHGRFSVKTNVYNYGVFLLEIITGQKCNERGNNCWFSWNDAYPFAPSVVCYIE
jgi:hypothetical protein